MTAPIAAASAAVSACDTTATEEAAAEDEGAASDELQEGEFEVDGDSISAAPLMVSTAGDEELTRTGEEREVQQRDQGAARS